LDGPTTLAYARNRHTAGGEFDRAYRQQQVILAMRDQVLRRDQLPQLISRAPQLYDLLSAGIQTNLTLRRVIQLAWLAKDIDTQNIRTGSIGSKDFYASASESGEMVYQPNPDRIRSLVADLFPSSNGASALSLQEGMLNEEARLAIVDHTGLPERAQGVVRFLEARGFQVNQISTGEERLKVTQIIDYTGKPYTMRFLAVLMGVTTDQIRTDYTPGSEADIVILLGTDWIQKKLD
jgi:hypothetical protein